MRISIVGLGYVGLVTSAGLSEWGHDVVGIEASPSRLDSLRAGRMPFFEPALDEMVQRHTQNGRFRFVGSEDAEDDLVASDIVMVAVGTHDGKGGWETATATAALTRIVPAMADDAVLVVRSTLPPDFVASLPDLVHELRRQHGKMAIPILLNPEFTREGRAVRDFLHPDRVVLGVIDDPEEVGVGRLQDVYVAAEAPIVVLPGVAATLSKLGANLFLATKISFVNELAVLCDRYGADVDEVVSAMAFDARIGGAFLRAGVGFGGSCLPHQVTMTVRTAVEEGLHLPLLTAVDEVNHRQRARFVDLVMESVDGIESPRVALLGLTFKPDTDDLRDAPALTIAEELLRRGAAVRAYDPMSSAARRAAEFIPGLEIAGSAAEAVDGVHAIGLVTEWPEFSALDWNGLHELAAGTTVVDGRNALSPTAVTQAGFAYRAFGRGSLDAVAAVPVDGEATVPIRIESEVQPRSHDRGTSTRRAADADLRQPA